MTRALGKLTNNPQREVRPRRCKAQEAAWFQPFSLRSQSPSQLGGLLCLPGHLGSVQPSTPHPPVAPSPEPWPQSSTLSPGMWPQRPAPVRDQQHSPHHALLTHPQSGSQMGPNPSLWQSPTQTAADRAATVGHPHMETCNTTPTQQHSTLCTNTNPKAVNTPRCKETETHSSSGTQRHWYTDASLRAHTAGQRGTHKYTERDAETQRDTYMEEQPMHKCTLTCKPKHTPNHTHTAAPGPPKELQLQLKWYVNHTSQGDPQSPVDPHPASPAKGPTLAAGRPHPSRQTVPPAAHPWSCCSEGIPSAVSAPPAQQEPGAWGPLGPLRSS